MPSSPIKTREEDGAKIVWGQSGKEWVVSLGVLLILWTIMGCIFASFTAIAQTIRDNGVLYVRPEREPCLAGDDGCKATFIGLGSLCGTGNNGPCLKTLAIS